VVSGDSADVGTCVTPEILASAFISPSEL